MIVAIDGPAGAGKSTVARALAARLGFGYLDTGAMYRAVAWLALEHGVPLDDADAVGALAEAHPVELRPRVDGNDVSIGGRDVTGLIRTARVSAAVSPVAAHPSVRRACVAAQRALLAAGDWVCDGRDIGTVVWPGAEAKVFLVATPEERARRRRDELEGRGETADLAAVLADIERRDHLDSTRADSPLRAAPDAITVDTTGLPIDAVTDTLAEIVADRTSGVRS